MNRVIEAVKARLSAAGAATSAVRVTGRVALSPTARLLVVEFAGKQLLIGQSGAALTLLASEPA